MISSLTAGLHVYGAVLDVSAGNAAGLSAAQDASGAKLHIRVFNSHLTAYPYGPYLLRDGATVDTAVRQTTTSQLEGMHDRLVEHDLERLPRLFIVFASGWNGQVYKGIEAALKQLIEPFDMQVHADQGNYATLKLLRVSVWISLRPVQAALPTVLMGDHNIPSHLDYTADGRLYPAQHCTEQLHFPITWAVWSCV